MSQDDRQGAIRPGVVSKSSVAGRDARPSKAAGVAVARKDGHDAHGMRRLSGPHAVERDAHRSSYRGRDAVTAEKAAGESGWMWRSLWRARAGRKIKRYGLSE